MDTNKARANKRKGAGFETDLLSWFRDQGWEFVERLARAGKDDEGDLVIHKASVDIIIEAKNVKNITLSQFIDEAKIESLNYIKHRKSKRDTFGVAVIKRRNTGINKSYVAMELEVFNDLLKLL